MIMFRMSRSVYVFGARCVILFALFPLLSWPARGENRLLALQEDVPLHPAVTAFFSNDDEFISEVVIVYNVVRSSAVDKEFSFIS